MRLQTHAFGRRRAASVLMPLARKPTDVVAEDKRACQRGRTTACAKKKSSEEAFRHKLLCYSEAGKSSPRIVYAREVCLFIARLLSDDRCCNARTRETAQQ